LTFENNIIRNCIFEYDGQTDKKTAPTVIPDIEDMPENVSEAVSKQELTDLLDQLDRQIKKRKPQKRQTDL
jgi:hypothetical protein